jgi:hypothetical protein
MKITGIQIVGLRMNLAIFKENGFGKQDMQVTYKQLLQSFNLAE